MYKKIGLVLVAVFVLSAVSTAYETDKTYKLRILHSNDHHGRFWHNRHGEYGMAARKTLVDQLRVEAAVDGSFAFLVSGGDINTGIPESDVQNAEPDFLGMHALGYDAMALGNHEFDNPMSVLRQQEEWAGFPFLGANIYQKSTGKRLFRPYTVYSVNGLKIAFVGFVTEETSITGNPQFLGDVRFTDPVAEAQKLVTQLRDKVDMIIVLTHVGHYGGGKPNGFSGDVNIAEGVEGIALIVGGHTQIKLDQPDLRNGTYIVQAQEWGKYVGKMDMTFRNGQVEMVDYRLIPVNLKKKVKVDGEEKRVFVESEIPHDPEMLRLLQPYQEEGEAGLGIKIGSVDGKLDGEREMVRFKETNMGNLIAKAQMEKAQADLAVMNSGGIRAAIEAGDISYRDVLTVQPFANTVVRVELTGAELMDYLQVVVNKKQGTGAFAQFYNVSLKLEGEQLVEVTVQGNPLVASKKYVLALNSYIASGGDGYPKVSDRDSYIDTGFVDADALKEYIEQKGSLSIADYAPTDDVIRN